MFRIPLERADPHQVDAYDYELDASRIARAPDERGARLLVVGRQSGRLLDRRVADLPELLRPNDLLVFNDTRVIPARVYARKRASGGRVELLAYERASGAAWSEPGDEAGGSAVVCMTRSSGRLGAGQILEAEGDGRALRVIEAEPGRAIVWVPTRPGEPGPLAFLEACGALAIPPYIERARRQRGDDPDRARRDERDYQTSLATAPGAVAAPTAGLHFRPPLLEALDAAGVRRASVTLHVGPGTFRPLGDGALSEQSLHAERYEVPAGLAETIERARRLGGRLIPVGTTSARVIEAEARRARPFAPGRRQTELFLHPGSKPRALDGLVTNLHLPRSSLLTLVASVCGYRSMRRAYEHALKHDYRFYSYGDAMWIDPEGSP